MSELTALAQVALLLTARWATCDAKPLTPKEFSDLYRWMGDRAEDLLHETLDLDLCPLDPARIRQLMQRGIGVFQSVDRWTQAGIWVRSWDDPGYPNRFKSLQNRAPVLVFGLGEPNWFTERAIAIVGSRNASPNRLEIARAIGSRCAESALTVVSGGARGVDLASMQGCLNNGGRVVGVLADSLLKVSGLSGNRDAIMDDRLCLMTEVHPEASFDVGSAMSRNRLAYACADATVIVECEPGTGGSWAGACDGLKEGRTVYVLQGAMAEKQLVDKGAMAIDEDAATNPIGLLEPKRPAKRPKERLAPSLGLFAHETESEYGK
ncbi:MAG TPA: DNA-processing protein DprA [Fimbriimonadaceae bacterium]|nr:DNA-processing protein DprA [Fimbriimonadaceae bacterium]